MDAKQEAKKQWGADPAGSHHSKNQRGTKEFFDEVTRCRYQEQPWTKRLIIDLNPNGKSVLEIGVGLGTDHLEFAKNGAKLTGIDITPLCVDLTKKRFFLESFSSNLQVGDAELLPFPTSHFDMVYSFGVLHHTDNIQRAIDEVHRVLKPGGLAVITLYNKFSLFIIIAKLQWLFAKLQGSKKTWDERLSYIEMGGDGAKPFVLLSSKTSAQKLFRKFSKILIKRDNVGLSGRKTYRFTKFLRKFWLGRVFEYFIAQNLGWYLVVKATK